MDIKITSLPIEDSSESSLFSIFMAVLPALLNSSVSIGGKMGIPPFFLGGGSGSFSWDRVTEAMSVERTGGVVGKGISCTPPESLLVSIHDGPGIGESHPAEGRLEG